MELVAVLLLSLVISLLLQPLAIRVSHFFGVHGTTVTEGILPRYLPALGGLGLVISFLGGLLAANLTGFLAWNRFLTGLVVGGLLAILVGVIDDRYGMRPTLRLVGQLISAGLLGIFAGVRIGLFNPVIEFVALILFMALLMNAFSVLDSIEGVTGSMSFACALAFLAVAVLAHDMVTAVICAALIGAATGFLRYNLPPSHILMGSGGATFVGFVLGSLSLLYLTSNASYYLVMTPFLILSYPILDILMVGFSRLREPHSAIQPAANSSPYRLIRLGIDPRHAFMVVLAINFLLGIMGVTTYILKGHQLSVLVIFLCGLLLSVLGVHLYRNFLFFFERTFYFVVDLVSINLAFYLVYAAKYRLGIIPAQGFIPYSDMLAPALWVSLFWVVLFSVMGLYDIRHDRRFTTYVVALLKIVAVGMVLFIVLNVFYEGKIDISPMPVLAYLVLLVITNLLFKYVALLLVRLSHSRPSSRPLAVVAIKGPVAGLSEVLQRAQKLFRVAGYLSYEVLQGVDLPYLGTPTDLAAVIRVKQIEQIVLVWPENDFDHFGPFARSLCFLENQFVVLGQVPQGLLGLKVEPLRDAGVSRVSMELMRTWEWATKQVIDLVISAVILLVTSPIFVYEYFRARRHQYSLFGHIGFVGRDGKEKRLFCFKRTLAKLDGEPKEVIISLPALLNVLRGDLSLVGTVPLVPLEFARRSLSCNGFWRRTLVKPGIFGPAHGQPPEEAFQRELRYLANMSIIGDIKWLVVGLLGLLRPRSRRSVICWI